MEKPPSLIHVVEFICLRINALQTAKNEARSMPFRKNDPARRVTLALLDARLDELFSILNLLR